MSVFVVGLLLVFIRLALGFIGLALGFVGLVVDFVSFCSPLLFSAEGGAVVDYSSSD